MTLQDHDNKTLRQQFEQLAAEADHIRKRQDALKAEIRSRMGEGESLDAGDGFSFELQHRQSKEYDKTVLRKYLDEDQLDLVLKPDMKKAKDFLKHAPLTDGARSELENTMIVVSESAALILKAPK